MTGTVSNIVSAKKYGFISADDGQEYFFHMTDVLADWDDLVDRFVEKGGGMVKVTFETARTPKGPRAKNISIVD